MSDERKRYKEDKRPRCGWWAPGDYLRRCNRCEEAFLGDKRAYHCADCANFVEEAINKYGQVKAEIAGLLEFQADVHRITREMDVVMFGEDGAAKQASLCDMQSSVKDVVAERDRLAKILWRLLKGYDPETDSIPVEPDPGCQECTCHTTPKSRETGVCPYHAALSAIEKAPG